MEKWGGMRKKVGEGGEGWGMRNGGGVDREIKVEQRMKKGKSRIGKAFTQCKKGSAEKIMGGISRRSARSVGEYREKQGKSEFRG